MNRLLRFCGGMIATTFGTGFFPLGPGTVGSLVAATAFVATPETLRLQVLPVILLIGWIGCEAGRRLWGEDPSKVTIDEVAGCWISCLAAPKIWGFWGVLAAFLLFRVFDIAKPWPVSALDRVKSGLGILLDDIAAGLMAAGCLLLLNIII